MHAEKIISIRKVGTLPTVDIEVDNDKHIFYADGIVAQNSHGVGYGKIGYLTAYVKTHFPIHFYTSWLYYAKDKQFPLEEIQELVEDAKQHNININPPTIKYSERGSDIGHFFLENKNIYFGLSDVKQVGESSVSKLIENIKIIEGEVGVKIKDWTWYIFLTKFAKYLSSSITNNLLAVGATDYMSSGLSRDRKCFEYNIYNRLTQREQDYISYVYVETLEQAIEKLLNDDRMRITSSRKDILRQLIESLRNSSYTTEDTAYQILIKEEELLGVPITYSRLDNCFVESKDTIKHILDGKMGKVTLTVEIASVRKHTIKSGTAVGQTMAFLKITDKEGSFIESVCVFAEQWKLFKELLYKGNTVIIDGVVSNKKGETSIIVNKVTQI